jgi:hypothetical protein
MKKVTRVAAALFGVPADSAVRSTATFEMPQGNVRLA